MSSPFQKLLGRMASKNIPSIVEQEAIQKAEQAAQRGVVPYVHQADEILNGEVGQHIPGNAGGGGFDGGGEIFDTTARHIDDSNLPAVIPGSVSGDIPQIPKQGWSAADKTLATLGLGTAGVAGYRMMGGDEQQQVPSPMALPSDQPTREVASQQAPPAQTQPSTIKSVSQMKMSAPSTPTAAPDKSIDVDFGTGNQDTAQALQDAQDRENQIVLINQLGKAGNTISAGLAGSGAKVVGNENFDSNIEQAHNVTKQQQARMEKAKNDPNSPLSQGMKRFMQSFGFNVKGDATAEDLMKLSPLAEKYYQSVQNREEKGREFDLKQKELGLKREELSQNKQNKADEKKSATDVQRIDRIGKSVVSELASSRSQFGKDRQALSNVDNIKALIDGRHSLDDVDPRQMQEIARGLDRIVSGGNPTISGTEHLTPDSAYIKARGFLEKITNKRQGAGAGSFIQTQEDSLDREKIIAQDRLARTAAKILAPAQDLRDHPNMQMIMQQNDIPDSVWNYAGKTATSPSSTYTPAQEAKIRVFMRKNPTVKDPAEAAKILNDHGHL